MDATLRLDDLSLPDQIEGYSKRRIELVKRAVKEWTQQLIDLGGRNNLLNYRDLQRGTLDLTNCNPAALSRLLQGKPTKISALVTGDVDRENVMRRVRTISKKASENFEERGIETLSLACGLATWENTKSAWQPHAPVLLRSASVRSLGASQEDFELTLLAAMDVSPTLLHVLRVEFDCQLDPDELLERIDGVIDEAWELEQAYEWMKESATAVPGFDIEPRLILANFAYTKLPMVRDLNDAFEELVAHDLIAAIAGDEDARDAIRSSAPDASDIQAADSVPPQNEFLVLDADSSQNFAINAVIAGASLIIRGPPGTGKSQTIANLIGALAANGKKILFVAEKRAAIEAVLKRLHQKKLGDLVVDLHGGISSRRDFAQVIGRALEAIKAAATVNNESDLRRLSGHRKTLNKYEAALHDEREPWGLSVYKIRCDLMSLAAVRNDVRFRGDVLTGLNASTVPQVEDDLQDWVRFGGLSLSSSPWANSRVETDADVQAAYELTDDVHRSALPAARQCLESISSETGLPSAPTLSEWEPRLHLMCEVEDSLNLVVPAIYEQNLGDLCDALGPAQKGGFSRIWSSLISQTYRDARRTLRNLCTSPDKVSDHELLDRCEIARRQLRDWTGFGAETNPSLPADYGQARRTYSMLIDGLKDVESWVGVDDLCDLSPIQVEQRLKTLLDDRNTLVNLPELKRLRRSLQTAGLADFLTYLEQGRQDCVQSFQYSWLQSILDHISISDRTIGGFVPEAHQSTVQDFQLQDRAHIETTPGRIKRICAQGAVAARNEFKQEDEIIRHQANLKRKHMPVRDLIRTSSDVLLALKPCWAMSPLVVSQLLPPGTNFDVVIFDEASQIIPADAIPSILRGTQLVVAGDERQLPPTVFFSTGVTADDDDGDEEARVPIVAGTEGFESIMDGLANLPLHPPKTLEWHYRSRDERLIAFSNAHIYDRMLTTFPGSSGQDVLRHVIAPWDPAADTNSPTPEVDTVVELILEHAASRHSESLGVIAMGIKHANRIEEALRLRLRENPQLEEELSAFFDEEREERFFIKNLERVQGDERDAIILSIGYGKNSRGDLPYRFGPLLVEGGERRLNVAVTRAKKRMTLVSSFSSKDMDPERSEATGVQLLRHYLQYVESLGTNLGDFARDKPQLNPFEVNVRDTLAQRGLKLTPQYGTSGYWIDFAVQHPDRPGDYILAIECDGAMYHSSSSARDRDRLRQEQLERLGWRFCRIWSTEWFYDKEKAIEKVLRAYEDALLAADGGGEATTSEVRPRLFHTPEPLIAPVITDRTRDGPRPPVALGRAIDTYMPSLLVRLVRWIESDGVLRTEDELVGDMMKELGFKRRGSNVVAAIKTAIVQAHR